MIRALVIPGLAMCVFMPGCSRNQPRFRYENRLQLERVERLDAFDAARATMAEYFRIDVLDARRGLIRSAPHGGPVGEISPSSALSLSSGPQRRRIAELWIEAREPHAVLVSCVVLLQENRTAERRTLAYRSATEDIPNRTPLEESEGFGDESDAVWTTVGHDTQLQRELLEAVSERLRNNHPAAGE